jgi:hypothetical protein
MAVDNAIDNFGDDKEEEDDMRPMAGRGVALVIGNGSYDVWPDVSGAPIGSNRMCESLSGYGYRVIHCNNADRETMEKAISQYRTAAGEMAAASIEAKRIKACGVQGDSSEADRLLQDLTDLTLKDLRARAMEDGASPVELEDLLHDDDPKEATIAFCMERELAKKDLERKQAGENVPEKPWTKTEQQQLGDAWAEYMKKDEEYFVAVHDGVATDEEWQDHRDNKWSALADAVITRDETEIKARVALVGKTQLTNPPGLEDGEVACIFYYCGHGCQIEGRNYMVPTDASVNPSSKDLIPVDDTIQARCGDQATQDRIRETFTGPNIIILDAARKIAPGSLDRDHRDTFRCPLRETVMVEPVYLLGEPEGWRYEKAAIEAYFDRFEEAHEEYRSPMSFQTLFEPNHLPPKLTRKVVLDSKLQHRINSYVERSTLNQMEPIVENTILFLSARPHTYGDDDGVLFTKELLKSIDGSDAVGLLFTKTRIGTLRSSNGNQVCWHFNSMSHKGTFCISGQEPIVSGAESPRADDEAEELLSICMQVKDQLKGGTGKKSNKNKGDKNKGPEKKGCANKVKQAGKSVGNMIGSVKPSLKSYIGLTQILGGMSFAFDIEWPNLFDELVALTKLLSIDVASLLPMGCFAGVWTFTGNFYFQIGYPLIVLLLFFALYKVRKSQLPEQVDPPDREIKVQYEDLTESSLNACFTFIFMIFPAVSQTIFKALIPQPLSEDTTLLRVDFQVDFESTEHTVVMYVAVLMILVYPLGIPIAIVYMLSANRDGLLTPESVERKRFDPLVGDYKLTCYYWEAIEMFRKVLLTGIMSFFVPGSIFQLIFGVLISAGFLGLSVSLRPYLSRFNNRFKIATDIAVLATFSVAIMMNANVDRSGEPEWIDDYFFDIVFTIVNVIVPLGVVVVELLVQMTRSAAEAEQFHGHAWLDDEKQGGFKVLVMDDSERLRSLRYDLETTDLKELNVKAVNAGLSRKEIQDIHSGRNPKGDMIDAIMLIAKEEGQGRVGKNGPMRNPIGTVAVAFGFQGKIEEPVDTLQIKFANPVDAGAEYFNPVGDSTFDVDGGNIDGAAIATFDNDEKPAIFDAE